MNQLLLWLLVLLAVASCKKDTVAPVSERIQKVWSANSARENGVMVYTKGATANIRPGYASFSLNLSSAAGVTLKEFDGTTFSGQWEVSSDEKRLTLKNLTPAPTGTTGTIEYTIDSLADGQLTLTRTTTSAKTGGTSNIYELTSL